MSTLHRTTAASRSAAGAWVLYDVASSAYAMMIPSVLYPVYFRNYVAGGGPAADAIWGIAVALPLIAAGLLGPVIGAVADTSGRRRQLLTVATVVACLCTALLVTVVKGNVLLGVAIFASAHLAYVVATSLYDSYLPLVAPPGSAARLSGFGWGLGYVGGIAAFFLTLPFLREGISDATAATVREAFLVVAGFFAALALPSLALLRRLPEGRSAESVPANAYSRVWQTVRGWRRDREVPKFLLAFYLVNDAAVTIGVFTPIFISTTFGLPIQEILKLVLLFHFVAIPATMAFGWLGERWSQRGAIYVTLAIWMVALALLGFGTSPQTPLFAAIVLGLVLGSTQSLFRSLFARLVPTDRVSEYFGFHGLAGKVSAALGPLTFGLISAVTGDQRLAMLSLAAFFIGGAIALARVRLPRGL